MAYRRITGARPFHLHPNLMLQRNSITAVIAACFVGMVTTPAAAQAGAADSMVRVHVITLDSTWYITGQLVAITGDSVVVQGKADGARLAFERIHVLSVELWKPSAGAGHSALVGCAILGGTLGLLGAVSKDGGGSEGGDGSLNIGGPVAGLVLGVVGCAVGGLLGAVVAAVNNGSWQPIPLPPRTGTEFDTSSIVRPRLDPAFPQHLM
jgi:hypothetical protein